MKNIIFIGPPGAGKGTQSKKLEKKVNFYHLSTGDIIRKEIDKKSEKGLHFSSLINSGKLLEDEDIFPLVKETVQYYFNTKGEGIIYDGFPRTLSHALFLDQLLREINQEITAVIHVSVNFDTLLKRIDGRLICKKCNENYNIFFKKPLKEGICNFCQGSELEKRGDDSLASFNKRLDIYKEETYPLLEFYKKRGLVKEIDGEKEDKEVFFQLMNTLQTLIEYYT